jgi:glycosyltransferase involved in cell wall biosynthesis
LGKKRILVVTSDVPFVEGGHLTIAWSTVQALRYQGFDADLVLTPQNRFGRQFRAYLANRCTDVEMDGLGRPIHQVISFRFPSYAVKHPIHVCWLNHRLRDYYDLWDQLRSRLTWKGLLKESLRRLLIRRIDTYLLKHNVAKVYAQSATIQKRLERWGHISSEILYPPPPQRSYRTESYQNFIFTVSRLHKLKRIDLLVEAFRHVKNKDVKAFIIGEGPEWENLSRRIREYGLDARVHMLGSANEENVMSHYGRCLAVFFCPLHEDYGFVTAEAFASRKAVLTATDSGGPTELVKDGESGFILSPDPKNIAEKIDVLAETKGLAEKMGQSGYRLISQITWPETVKKLVMVSR